MGKTFGLVLSAGISALALSAGGASAKDLVFGLIANNMAFPYNVVLADGFKEQAAAKGVKVIVLDSKMSMETQANQMDDLLLQKVDGIAFMPNDSVAVTSLVDKVAAAGVPIVASAVPVGDPAKTPVDYVYPALTALVSTNDVDAGRIAGEYSANLLPKDREVKIAVVEGAPGFSVVGQREQGFEAALKKAGIQYKIVSSQPSDWTPESGEQICQNALTSDPDIDMIFSHADDMALGCAKAIDAAGSQALLIATGGGSDRGANAIKLDEIDASVCTQPKLIGAKSFDILYAAATDPASAKKGQYVSYDMFAVTKDNLANCPLTGW
ncbi:sugar ABC transporter substrate-binding protein [Ensifer sp. ENS07]|uniref:sugar ABC transporter substrate-binding protein n=1 Tax=Ensifer sp. ENS07 TaxID=2769274 RepID=UPI001784B229|nr:sugar ABC transporter substrate-binding protein [Ensifer sp. ENS07]MBD9638832.1 sugar ABC transporter substrate-binding protein [Ensifer sp. ENS07]